MREGVSDGKKERERKRETKERERGVDDLTICI